MDRSPAPLAYLKEQLLLPLLHVNIPPPKNVEKSAALTKTT